MNEKQWKIEFSSSNSSCEQAGHDVTFERSLRSRNCRLNRCNLQQLATTTLFILCLINVACIFHLALQVTMNYEMAPAL